MSKTRMLSASAIAAVSALVAAPALAVPVTIVYAGYWHETVGSNGLGHAGGGSTAGTPSTLFVAETIPGPDAGTTASASFGAVATNPPVAVGPLWTRRKLNPDAAQLEALTVKFENGADSTSFTGRSLAGVAPMPLVQNLTVDGSATPFAPSVSWVLPADNGFDLDYVQLVFYSNVSKAEIGSRVTLDPTATHYDIVGPLTPGLDLVINLRLVDLYDDAGPFAPGNFQSISRAYVNYLVPVPEPGSWLLLALGLTAMPWVRRRARSLSH